VHRQGHHRVCPVFDDIERDQRFRGPRKRLAHDKVDTGVDRPADLLLEHRAHCLVGGIGRIVDIMLQISPANSAPLETATSFASASARLIGPILLAADDAEPRCA
jgi:hypothetical protein